MTKRIMALLLTLSLLSLCACGGGQGGAQAAGSLPEASSGEQEEGVDSSEAGDAPQPHSEEADSMELEKAIQSVPAKNMISGETQADEIDRSAWTANAPGKMTTAAFWGGDDTVMMTPEEIQDYNDYLVELAGTGEVNLLGLHTDGQISAQRVDELIRQYSITEPYLDGHTVTQSEKDALYEERNLSALESGENVALRYGIVTAPADVRSLPTALVSSADGSTEGSTCIDDFQQTQLKVGEGVLIFHSSMDGEWYFAQAQNYYGWISASCVGLCAREEMEEYLTTDQFAVTLERKELEVNGVTMRLVMGTRLALDENQYYRIPTRTEDGTLELVSGTLDIAACEGYLPYTTKNLYMLASRLIGDPYSWGGKEGYSDCSATVLSIYDCFGIHLPRNTSAMAKIQRGAVYDPAFEDYAQLQPGTLLVMKGHVMLYLGEWKGEPYALQNFSKYFTASGERVNVYATEVTSIRNIYLSSGASFMSGVHTAVEVK